MMLSCTNFLLSATGSLRTMVSGVFVASSPAILAACFQSRGEAPRRQDCLSDDGSLDVVRLRLR